MISKSSKYLWPLSELPSGGDNEAIPVTCVEIENILCQKVDYTTANTTKVCPDKMMTECIIDENDPFYANIFHAPMLSAASATYRDTKAPTALRLTDQAWNNIYLQVVVII